MTELTTTANPTTASDSCPTVLVVDDDPGIVTTLRDILHAWGYEVDVARSGYEAVEHVRRSRPDCILMDIRMPGMDGVEAFRRIKRIAPDSPVIFVTAYADSDLVDDAFREGAVEVIPKPLDLKGLLRLLESVTVTSPTRITDDEESPR